MKKEPQPYFLHLLNDYKISTYQIIVPCNFHLSTFLVVEKLFTYFFPIKTINKNLNAVVKIEIDQLVSKSYKKHFDLRYESYSKRERVSFIIGNYLSTKVKFVVIIDEILNIIPRKTKYRKCT